MEFRRAIYKDLLKWKNTHDLDNVLVLQGAHGTGKVNGSESPGSLV